MFRGEAAPRSTDLAYELPNDFDPYARVEDGPPSQSRPTPSPQENKADPLDAATATKPVGTDISTTLSSDPTVQRRVIKINTWDAALNLDAFKKEGEEEVSLEELGRRRHQEWMESRKADGWAV
jgi:hypothetical protein